MNMADGAMIPYKAVKVHFLVEQVIIFDEIIESSAAA